MTNDLRDTFDSSIEPHRTLVLGFDFSDSSELALDQCLELARILPSVTIHVVWVPQHPLAGLEPYILPVDHKSLAEHLKHHIGQRAFARKGENTYGNTLVEVHVASGDPVEAINEHAFFDDADLIVVGTHGRRGLERLLLGSIAADVLATAPCPVLIARPRAPVPRVEPPRTDLSEPTLGHRHTYHTVDRNTRAHENMPLIFPHY